jgi:drug/metabolite transporter (DMT)-like permease
MKLDPTLVAARILGPLFALAGIMLIIAPDRAIASAQAFSISPLLSMGAFVTLTIGLVLVALHQRFETVTASIITLIGWLCVARGGVMLLAPNLIEESADFISRNRQAVPIAGCVAALLGVWLTYTGYVAGMLRFDHPSR